MRLKNFQKLGLRGFGILPTSMIFWHAISAQDIRPIMSTAFLQNPFFGWQAMPDILQEASSHAFPSK